MIYHRGTFFNSGFRLEDSDKKRVKEIIEEKGIELDNSKYVGIGQMLEVITNEFLEEAYEVFFKEKTKEFFDDLDRACDEYKVDFMDQFDDKKAKNIAMLYKTIAGMSEGEDDQHIKNAGYICYAYALNGGEPNEKIFDNENGGGKTNELCND